MGFADLKPSVFSIYVKAHTCCNVKHWFIMFQKSS